MLRHDLNQAMCLTDSPVNCGVEYRHISIYFGAVLKGVNVAGIYRQDVFQLSHSEAMANYRHV